MGILDSLENNPALRSALGQLGAAVLPAVLSEVLGSNNQGGLSAIVAKLQQAGFGDQVKSWLGNGQNLPISADQLRAVLGNDTVRQLAARYNIPVDQLGQILAQELPKAVDQASPQGSSAPYRLRPGSSGISVARCSRYRPEKTSRLVCLPCSHEAGQKRRMRAI
ncbi:uncharacterized protein YidB (DUF937 family) [Bradyrhizobium japonicum]